MSFFPDHSIPLFKSIVKVVIKELKHIFNWGPKVEEKSST
jgi:hypothetical protein